MPSPPPWDVGRLGTADDDGATSHYDDAAYYDVAYRSRRHDVDYYVRLGRLDGGPVLEYGIGTGRVALALARAGIPVVGVERAKPMLASLKGKLKDEPEEVRRRIEVISGDMRSARVKRRFSLIIAPFNAIQHLYTRRDVERFFARVREHLKPRGRFVFDFLMPSPEDLGADPARPYGAPRFRHPTAGIVHYTERFEYEAFRQVLLVHMEFKPRAEASAPFTVPLTHRQFFPQEMEALLHYNGFADLRFSADFTDRAPVATTESVVVSCRAAAKRRA